MTIKKLKESIEGIDIYLIDQILKERYQETDKILDAGCGSGRNLRWFYKHGYNIFGIDFDLERLEQAKNLYPNNKDNFILRSLEKLPHPDNCFNHIICCAVLHFAKNNLHFENMFSELVRVLKPNGTLFIRMASDIGIEKLIVPIANGTFKLPDDTERFLLTKALIEKMVLTHKLSFLEPMKTVNVNDKRCMTTLVLRKL